MKRVLRLPLAMAGTIALGLAPWSTVSQATAQVSSTNRGKEITLTPGQTFYEGPDDVHTVGRNASATKPAKFVVVMVKKKGVDAVLPAE